MKYKFKCENILEEEFQLRIKKLLLSDLSNLVCKDPFNMVVKRLLTDKYLTC